MRSTRNWFKFGLKSDWVVLPTMIVLILAARSSLADHYHVPSGSMEYTIMPGDRVLVDKTAYGLRVPFTSLELSSGAVPTRGEVAIFDSPIDGDRLIKRIAAVGGDAVTLIDGHLHINGTPIGNGETEQFGDHLAALNLRAGGGPNVNALIVPQDHVLALGDHRGNSIDSRYFGVIPTNAIYGRALGIYYRSGSGFIWQPL